MHLIQKNQIFIVIDTFTKLGIENVFIVQCISTSTKITSNYIKHHFFKLEPKFTHMYNAIGRTIIWNPSSFQNRYLYLFN